MEKSFLGRKKELNHIRLRLMGAAFPGAPHRFSVHPGKGHGEEIFLWE